jgi:hypothetical protein
MGFGFLNRLQQVLDFTANGVAYASAHTMDYVLNIVGDPSVNTLVTVNYEADNVGPPPDQKASGTTTGGTSNPSIAALYDGNIRLGNAAAIPDVDYLAMDLLRQGSSRGMRYLNHDTTGIPGVNRFKHWRWVFQNPDRILHFGVAGGGASSSGTAVQITDFNFPNFPNLKSFYFRGASSAAPTGGAITNFKGRHSQVLEAWGYIFISGFRLETVEHPFPASLKQLMLGSNFAALGADLPRLIAACVNLESLILHDEQWEFAPSANTTLPITGSLNLSHITGLKNFSYVGTGLTNLDVSGLTNTDLKRLRISNATAFDASKLLTLIGYVLNSPVGEMLNIDGCEKTLTRSFVDGEFATLKKFIIGANKITGSITITTARPQLTIFRLGTNADRTLANRHVFQTVNVSGLTGATTIDLTNSKIEFVTLPVNTVCTALYLGGNALTIANNPNIISQIRAMTGITDLRFSTGTSGTTDSNCGALGAVNVDNLNLATFIATNGSLSGVCQIKGTNVLTLWVNHNPLLTSLLSSTGVFPGTLNLQLHQCPLLNFDFLQLRNFSVMNATNIGNTVVDLSNVGSATITTFSLSGCANLTEVRFPTTPLNIAFNISQVSLFDNPNLSSLPNVENMKFLTGSSSTKNFYAYNCALNITFPFGTNEFTPPRINIQNNGMSVANVDATITNIYNNRGKWVPFSVGGGKQLIIGGTNASPTGIFQAPAGFSLGVSDGTPASVKEMLYVLNQNYGFAVSYTP